MPHGRERVSSRQRRRYALSPHSVLLCLETPSKRQRMDPCEDLLSCNETVIGGSPEVVFPQPPTDAIHKEGSCSSNLPCIFKSVLALETKDTPSYTGALLTFRGPLHPPDTVPPVSEGLHPLGRTRKQECLARRTAPGTGRKPSWRAVCPCPVLRTVHSSSLC